MIPVWAARSVTISSSCLRELTTLLLRQVEIPVHDSAHEDRDTEEAPHQRMPGRKAEEVWLLRHVGNAERARLPKEDAENPVVARQVADPSPRLFVDPRCDEPFQV